LRNPLRETCTAGSVRGEIPGKPRWTYSGTKLETADTAKESLQLPGLLYSERWRDLGARQNGPEDTTRTMFLDRP
jgi:hypothetical protein